MNRHASTNSPGPKGFSDSAKMAARETMEDVRTQLARGYESLTAAIARKVRGRPGQSVLVALSAGLILGRFKVRPVETVLLAAAAGFLLGKTLANGRRHAEH